MSFTGYIYAGFSWMGKIILKMFKNLDNDIRSADLRIYPEAYASLCGFVFIIMLIISIGLSSIISLSSFFKIHFIPPQYTFIISILLVLVLPTLTLLIMILIPFIMKVNRISRVELEIPYFAAYISTMATGGISPYVSFERIAKAPSYIFREVKKEAARFFIKVRALGKEPLTAIEESAKNFPSKTYRELMLGYAATLRSGGDVVHYLYRQTEMAFKEMVSVSREVSERIGILLESYMAITVILALSLYTIFIVNNVLAQVALPTIGMTNFVFFAYIFLPAISGVFIYLADLMQPQYPVSDNRPYYVYFLFSLPVTIILVILFAIPFMGTVLPFPPSILKAISFSKEFIEGLNNRLGLPEGFESGIGISLSLIIGIIPSVIATEYCMREYRGIQSGITRFLRDLVEVRKTGLSPEKCIINLSKRDYGRFSKHLIKIANQLGWGISLTKIYERFVEKVRNWLARITMFLLVESIQVGGGTPRTLEALASFAEMIELLDREKKRALKPLIIIPYISSIITTIVVLILIGFLNRIMGIANISVGVANLIRIYVPPVVLNAYITGLTAGKISTEKVYGGFLHALILTITVLVSMIFEPFLSQTFNLGF